MRHTARTWVTDHGWLVALAAGIGWIVNDLASRASSDPDYADCNSGWDYATNALDPPTFFLTAAGIWAVYLAQQGRLGRMGTIAAFAAGIGLVLAGINNPIEHCGDVGILGTILWAPATLLLVFGTIAFGLATLRANVLPIWVGPALAAGVIALMAAGDTFGLLILGLTWLAIAYALRSRDGYVLHGAP
jgi:hypothetical protein